MLINLLKLKDVKQAAYKSEAHKDQSRRCFQTCQVGTVAHPHIHVPINSVKARTMIRWPQMPWGRKQHSKFPCPFYYTVVMYIFTKCYMGFCTLRHTIMESKKKKKNISVLE